MNFALPNYDWHSEIEKNLSLLSPLKKLSYEIFRSQPQYYGAAARFLQLLAKYTLEAAQRSPQTAVSADLQRLWLFHRPATLIKLNVVDIYQTMLSAERVVKEYLGSLS